MTIKVHFETYGCQMNVADTERGRHIVTTAGLSVVDSVAEADVVMLNTCSIRAKAERKVFSRVAELHHLTRHRQQPPIVGVMGCVAQLEGASLLDNHAQIDLVIGPQALERLPATLAQVLSSGHRTLDLGGRQDTASSLDNLTQVPALASRHSRTVAFVPIIEGCNKFCSYCIVPYARGREISRQAAGLVREVAELQAHGVREVHLIGQNVNSYRPFRDDYLKGYPGATPFAKLLRAVAATGIPRIKFTTSFPRDFHEDIIQALEEHPNLCNWVHLPVQSGSNKVLAAMRRVYTVEEYLKKVARLKNSPKNIALTTDLIVGYPGESEADFAATLDLFRACEFDSAYLFKYSPRPGTPSFALGDTVPESVKSERFAVLQELQKDIQALQQRRQVGQTLQVLVEERSLRNAAEWHGHSTCQRLVNFPATGQQPGDIVPVLIETVKTNSLYGRACEVPQLPVTSYSVRD